jgi:hypothetical protein
MKMNSSCPRFIFLPCLVLVLFAVSCKKETPGTSATTEQNDQVMEASRSEIILQSTFDDVFDNTAGIDGTSAGEDIGIYGSTGVGIFPGQSTNEPLTRCFTVTVTPKERGVFPKTVVIDFGTGCTAREHLRKGKIITVYSGPLYIPGNTAVTTFDGYQVDSFKVEGKHTIRNSTEPGSNQRSFSRTVENARLRNVNTGFWWSWSGTRVMKQVEGNGTPLFPLDDVYQFTGSKRGENANGKKWTATIVTPLVRAFSCRWISAGTIEIRVNDTVGVLDFGNGTCDNSATVTVNGVSRVISLR